MLQGGVTELIWHFAGHFHLMDELARARVQYEDMMAQQNALELEFEASEHTPAAGELEELGSGRTGVFWPQGAPYGLPVRDFEPPVVMDKPLAADVSFSADLSQTIRLYTPGLVQPGIGFVLGPNVTRQEGGDETNVDVDQYNLLNDNDRYGVKTGLTIEEVSGVNIYQELDTMRGLAAAAVPEDLFPAGGGNITVVGANLADILGEKAQSGEDPVTVEMGLHINGVLQSEAAEEEPEDASTDGTGEEARREGAPPPIAEQPDGWKPGDPGLVAAELGSNTAYNGAIIVDADEGVGTFVVLGDYFKTNVIAQTNVYTDSDHVRIAGGQPGAQPSVFLNENTTTNSAEFVSEALFEEAIDYRGYTGYKWNIDLSYGDYYDIKSLYQENVIYSNDITCQYSTGTYQRLMVDENGQWNASTVTDYGNSYDLIVVLGNYFSGNFIHQTNILLDNDWVTMTSGEDGGSQTVYAGQNALTNEASITYYGLNGFGEISAGFEEFLRGLETRDDISPQEWWSYSGSGSTYMNVLFVTGNYYDINYIEQLNLIADADAAMQLGLNGDDQFVSTGGNTATNFATIVDVGAYGDQYVGGEVYEDWTLIQTNIVSSEDDTVVYGNSDELASELVAFAYTDEEDSDVVEPGLMPTSMGGDELGHVMT